MPKLIDHQTHKELLAEAVWAVIVDDGVGAVSIRAVASRANVAVGSLRYLFPTRAELVAFAGELVLRRAAERIATVPLGTDRVTYALDVLRELLPLTPGTRAEMMVNLALIAETPAIPVLASIRDRTLGAIYHLCRRLVTLAHPDMPDQAADLAATRLAALTDGLALRLLAAPDSATAPAQALVLLRAELTCPRPAT
ncbi:MAG: TetR family transcriptional regulator C-terminal domain-containing protein [Bifidobacteriaceae bacterium]|nr:TetR family transcriptional regulator C-terminal domain-containing protein [Bifidobacteriaceae bacterium]